jgi:hypothetical protein
MDRPKICGLKVLPFIIPGKQILVPKIASWQGPSSASSTHAEGSTPIRRLQEEGRYESRRMRGFPPTRNNVKGQTPGSLDA